MFYIDQGIVPVQNYCLMYCILILPRIESYGKHFFTATINLRVP